MNLRERDGFVGRLLQRLEKPRAAFAYGVPMRELSHNWFLHTMLQQAPGPGLIHEIAKAVEVPFGGSPEAWNSLRF